MTSPKAISISVALVLLVTVSAPLRSQQDFESRGNPPSASDAGAGSAAAHPHLERRYPRYVIQRQDVLSIAFPLSPEMNQTLTVQPDGYVNLESTGSVHVQGLTVPDAAAAIKRAYIGVLNDPIINVDLQDFQKPFFTVSGQVGKPGQFELRSDITVAEAIAVAGGTLPTAKSQIFLFHRTSNDWFQVERISLKQILNGRNINEDPLIKPGDMVFVPESTITKFRKYLPYSANAGSYLSENP